MIRKRHVIIGCGPAALSALKEIRRWTSEDEVKLVSGEKYLPYSPAGLPYLISNKILETHLWSVDEDFFKNMLASFCKEKEVSKVLFREKEVVYSDGSKEEYDNLLIASGSQAEIPQVEGMEEISPLVFHTLDDYKLLRKRLTNKRSVAIYGGGLVAAEIAVHLLEAGYEVQLIVRSRILRQYFSQQIGDRIEDILMSQGAQIHKGATIIKIKRNKEKVEIALSEGHALHADLLIICTGVKPRTNFLKETDLAVNNGILVDRRMMSNIKDVYAAGDVAEAPDLFTGSHVIRPILISAIEQGKIAGSNMVGKEAYYKGSIRANIFNFFGNTAFSIGFINSSDKGYKVFQESVDLGNRYMRLVFDGDFLIGAESLNLDLDAGVFHTVISHRVKVSPYQGLLARKPTKISRWLVLQDQMKSSCKDT